MPITRFVYLSTYVYIQRSGPECLIREILLKRISHTVSVGDQKAGVSYTEQHCVVFLVSSGN